MIWFIWLVLLDRLINKVQFFKQSFLRIEIEENGLTAGVSWRLPPQWWPNISISALDIIFNASWLFAFFLFLKWTIWRLLSLFLYFFPFRHFFSYLTRFLLFSFFNVHCVVWVLVIIFLLVFFLIISILIDF